MIDDGIRAGDSVNRVPGGGDDAGDQIVEIIAAGQRHGDADSADVDHASAWVLENAAAIVELTSITPLEVTVAGLSNV